jgi:hypothetical protein
LIGMHKGFEARASIVYIGSAKLVAWQRGNFAFLPGKWTVLGQGGRSPCVASIRAGIVDFPRRVCKWDSIQKQSTILAIAEAAEH